MIINVSHFLRLSAPLSFDLGFTINRKLTETRKEYDPFQFPSSDSIFPIPDNSNAENDENEII